MVTLETFILLMKLLLDVSAGTANARRMKRILRSLPNIIVLMTMTIRGFPSLIPLPTGVTETYGDQFYQITKKKHRHPPAPYQPLPSANHSPVPHTSLLPDDIQEEQESQAEEISPFSVRSSSSPDEVVMPDLAYSLL